MSQQDYERAASLAEKLTHDGKVFGDAVHSLYWLDDEDSRFRYSVSTAPGGTFQNWLVDAATGLKTPCPLDLLPSSFGLPAFSPNLAIHSGDGRRETTIMFCNNFDERMRVFWMNWEGQKIEYKVVNPGETHLQHTYESHVWMVETFEGHVPICAFRASGAPSVALIKDARDEHSAISEKSPKRTWKAYVRDGHISLQRNNFLKTEVVLTTHVDGLARYRDDELYWSPDGKKFVAMHVSHPRSERFVHLVETSPTDQLQPKVHTISYPKPGDPLPQKCPHLFDVVKQKQIHVSQSTFCDSFELSEPRWDCDSSRFFMIYNQRGHQMLRVISINASTGQSKVIVEERSKTFIDYVGKQFIHYLDGTGELLWMSERDGWNHLYLYDSKKGVVKNQVTHGPWVVRRVEKVDESKREIIFQAGGIYPAQDPYHIHYCRISFDGRGLVLLTEGDGTHFVTFSPSYKYMIDTYSRVDKPPIVELRKVRDGSLVTQLETADISALVALKWKEPMCFVAKGRDGYTDIFGVIFRPTNLQPGKKYPIIEEIYAGPQDSHVPKAFKPYHSAQTLAELGFIVVMIDGMGTSNRSKAFHDVCAKNLGDAGLPDRVIWIKAAAKKFPYMDIDRVGIYGVSAGGQNALRALLIYPDFYKVGVSASGCHDNRMDKLWWNELWMGWPVGDHYHLQSNVTQAHLLQGKLLLIVCEMDRNVDPASTYQVVHALIKADKDFDIVVIPGEGHGIGGAYGERKMKDFFVRHLLGVEPRH